MCVNCPLNYIISAEAEAVCSIFYQALEMVQSKWRQEIKEVDPYPVGGQNLKDKEVT